jgi:hypothetical protein
MSNQPLLTRYRMAGAGWWSTLDTVPLSVTSLLTSYRESESSALSGTARVANRRPVNVNSPAISGIELMKRLCLKDSLLSRVMKNAV